MSATAAVTNSTIERRSMYPVVPAAFDIKRSGVTRRPVPDVDSAVEDRTRSERRLITDTPLRQAVLTALR